LRTISSLEMSAIDRNAIYLGIEPVVLMENAGRQVASEVEKRMRPGSVLLLCGPGNNGGDGYVAARHLRNAGWEVSVLEIRRPSSPQAIRNREILGRMDGIDFKLISDSTQVREPGFASWLARHDVIVDGLLGTGARGKLREPIASLVDATKDSTALRVAIDIPTGLEADTGVHGETVFSSDVTVTFHAAKAGHTRAGDVVGEVVVADIGIPAAAESRAGPGDLLFVRDRRDAGSHKGQNGVLLVVGGSKDYFGAPAICGLAAMRTGIDLVYLAVPEAVREPVAKHSPSLIVRSFPGDRLTPDSLELVEGIAEKCDALCVGPGLGADKGTIEAVRTLMEDLGNKPVVLDADGLKAFSGATAELPGSVVITPHGGEFRLLTGSELPAEMPGRREAVSEQASRTRCTWVVKGEQDVVARGPIWKINDSGTSCMTVGGSGDCLTGIIGALLSRGNDPFRSAVAGVFVAGKAGELASEKRGCHLLPTDIAEEVPAVFRKYE